MNTQKLSASGAASQFERVDLRAALMLLRRQMRVIALTFALFLGSALIFMILAHPLYTARTLLLVDPSQRNLLESDPYTVSSAQADNSKMDSEVEIIRAPDTALGVIKAAGLIQDPEFGPRVSFAARMKIALGLQSDAPPPQDMVLQEVILRLAKAMKVKRLGQTYLIAVDVTSKDPSRAAEIANIVAASYISGQVQAKINASLAARDILQGQADAGREALAASDAALDRFIEDNLSDLAKDASDPRIAQLRAGLEAQRQSLRTQEGALRAATLGLEQRDFDTLAQSLASDAVNELVIQRQSIAAQLQETSDLSQDFVDLRAELAGIESQLSRAATSEMTTLRANVAAQSTTLTNLRDELRSTLLQSDLSSQALAQIFELQQSATNARSQYQNIVARLAEVENQAAVQVAQSRIVSKALAPSQKSAPNMRLIFALTLVFGLGSGLVLALLNEFFIGGFGSTAQLEQISGLPVASAVPKVAGGVVADKIVQEPMGAYAESIRRLRAVLDQDLYGDWHQDQQPAQQSGAAVQPPQGAVIMVTSSVPAEGKSTLSLSLARVYAMSHIKTIIIDADLRKPSLAGHLGAEIETGLLDYLMPTFSGQPQNQGRAIPRIVADPVTPLHCVLGAGRAKVPTDQLLRSPSFSGLIRQLKQSYEIVIIDTAPLLPVVDARYVAHYADAVVMPVHWASTSQSDLRSAVSMLKPVMGRNAALHLVLSQSEQQGAGNGYDGYYGAP